MSGWVQLVMVLAVMGALALVWARYRRPASVAAQRDRVAPSLNQGFASAAEREDARRSPSL